MNVTGAGATCRRHSVGFPLAALFWRASGASATWSPHPEFSALPLITVPTTRRCNFAMCVIRPSALRPHRRACIVRHGHPKAGCRTRESRRSSTGRELWFAAGRSIPDGNAGAVGFHDRAYYVAGGFYHYANVLLVDATNRTTSTVLLTVVVTGVSMWIACRDVKISARLMLWIEAASLVVILTVVLLVLAGHGFHLDREQLHLRNMTGSGLRLGLVLALFSFV